MKNASGGTALAAGARSPDIGRIRMATLVVIVAT
jgi:hypothetical protein